MIYSRGESILVEARSMREAVRRYCKMLAGTGRLKVKGIEKRLKIKDLKDNKLYKATLSFNVDIDRIEEYEIS